MTGESKVDRQRMPAIVFKSFLCYFLTDVAPYDIGKPLYFAVRDS